MASSKTNLKKIGKNYYLRYKINGKEILKSLKTSNLKEAEQKRKDMLSAVRDVKTESDVIQKVARAKKLYNPKRFPLQSLWDKFKKILLLKDTSPKTLIKYGTRWNKFLVWIETNHPELINLSDITVEITKEYAEHHLSTGITNRTYNEDISMLFRTVETFKDESGITKNPFDKTYVPRRQKETISRKELSREQTFKLLESIPGFNLPYSEEIEVIFNIGVFSGMRMKDACLLKWDSIDFRTNFIYVVPFKTKKHGTRVQIPIHPRLKQYLLKAQLWKVDEYVLPQLAERYKRLENLVNKYIRKVFDENGFVNKEVHGRLTAPCKYGFHSLRYTFVSICAENNVPAALVQDIVGHMSPAMTKHYTRFSNDFKQKAINSLNFIDTPCSSNIKEKIKSLIDTADEKTILQVYDILNGDSKQIDQ